LKTRIVAAYSLVGGSCVVFLQGHY